MHKKNLPAYRYMIVIYISMILTLGWCGPASAQTEFFEENPAIKISAEPNWETVQKTENILRNNRDWQGLEAFFNDLITQYPNWAYGYSARGYLRLSQNRLNDARHDLNRALELETLPDVIADIKNSLFELNRDIRMRTMVQNLQNSEAELVRQEDWRGLVALYDEYVTKMPTEAWVLANRGFKKLDVGLVEDGVADLQNALRLNPDAQLIQSINNSLNDINSARSQGLQVGSAKANLYIYRAVELAQAEKWDEVTTTLAKLEGLILSAQQLAMLDYLEAQQLWAQDKREQAFELYRKATQSLPPDYFLSAAYAKMAEYCLMHNRTSEAAAYINKSLDVDPDFVWHVILAGNIYYAAGNYGKAVQYYAKAEQDGSLTLDNSYFYYNYAMAYRALGNSTRYDAYMRRHIDAAESRLALKPETTEAERMEIYWLKKGYTDAAKWFEGSIYIFGNYYKNDNYLSAFTVEMEAKVEPFGIRSEIYVKAYGTLTSHFTGTYFDPWSGSNQPYASNAHLRETIHGGIGYRVYLLDNFDLKLGLQQNLKMGRDTRTETLVVLDSFEAIGDEWEPYKANWHFASLYNLLEYSINYKDFSYGGEGRFGHSFKLGNLFYVTPFAALGADYGGKDTDKGSRWGFEAGTGIMFRKWVDPDDSYKVPYSNIDLVVQYRFGLSHKRQNAISVSLYYDF